MGDRKIDFTAAGWHWSGGEEYRLVPKAELREIQTTLEAALENIRELPKLDQEKVRTVLEPLCKEILVLRRRHADLLRDYWHNIFRAWALGAILAWILWGFLGVLP